MVLRPSGSAMRAFVHRLALVSLSVVWTIAVSAQSVSFTSSNLSGESVHHPTSLNFGPDNRLYVSQQDGTIYVYTIVRNGPNNYQVTATETINLVKAIPNHNDDGTLNTSITHRQVTGLIATGTASNPILYVSSSDPRIGGGGTAGDLNLDTNSGVVSRLTWTGSAWNKIDLVKGLPRSEENHASNGMVLDPATNILYLAQGGNTNAGSPSNNFAFITEYALSGAVLKIDLNQIETEFGGSYSIPTLDDPTRSNVSAGVDQNDPFGGNDGRNQARIVLGGPVQIHSPGYRNIYDLVLTEALGKSGRMYTIDNGPNGGWGGHPDQEGTFGNPPQTNVTNKYVAGEPGSTGPGPNDGKVNNKDNLHYVSGPGFPPVYGGHPNPIRANPQNAGLYHYDNNSSTAFYETSPTTDWPPVPVSMANPVEGDFRNPGVDDGALYTWSASTNGLVEYTSQAYFGGAMYGNLLAASFDGNVYRIQLSADGTAVTSVSSIFSGFGTNPLDIAAQGDADIFPGTVWVGTYASDNITVFEPVGAAPGVWQDQPYAGGTSPLQRHENAFVELGGKFYLVGGRGTKTVGIFDPVTKMWTAGAAPPFQMHHFQAVTYQNKIYVICAFTGNYPSETPVDHIYIYDPATNTWEQGDPIPVGRRRGSAGVVLYKNKFYIGGGIQNGHIDGWVTWMDEYDPATGQWTVLPDLPEARDHFHAGYINGKMYFVGGRRTGQIGVLGATVANVDVYDIDNGTWSTPTQIPTPRGAPAVASFNGTLLVAGGEVASSNSALNVVEQYDPQANSWTTLPPMNVGRHGSQLIVYGTHLYIAAGSSTQGSAGENNTMSYAVFAITCTAEYNSQLDEDGDGYKNSDEIDNGTDPCSAGSKPNDNDSDLISDLNDPDDDNDGLNDIVDRFALDPDNGQNTFIRVDYPFLNGDPGFGFFGVGHTGLMVNEVDNYASLFDPEDPDLIVGGAVGVLSAPASSGDARTNDQEYAFQFGVNVQQATPAFTIRSRILGSPFFDGIQFDLLADQSQGIYFGTGDQDNYFKIVLFANYGNPGIQLLREENGTVIVQDFYPIQDILSAEELDLLIDIDPQSGSVSFRYETSTDPAPVPVGFTYTVTGNLLDVLQNSPAMAVGVISSAGTAPPFSASWDYITITNSAPYVIQPFPDQLVFTDQGTIDVPLENIFNDDDGIETLTFEVSDITDPSLISGTNVSGTQLTLSLNPIVGQTTVTLKATDPNGDFAETSFKIVIIPEVVDVAHINSGGPTVQFGNTTWQSDQFYTGGSSFSTSSPIGNTTNDAVFQTERYGNFSYAIPVPANGNYYLDLLFAEIYHGVSNGSGVGARLFNVSVENSQFDLQNFDVFQQAGGAATALVIRVENIQVNDGFLNISFTTVKDNAKVSGISVFKYPSGPTPDAPPYVIAPYPKQQVTIGTGSLNVPLDQLFGDDNGFAGLTVEVTDISNPALVASTQITATQLAISLQSVLGSTIVSLKATDANQGFIETTFEIEIVAVPQGGVPIVHINSGGTGLQSGNETWVADQYFTGGGTHHTSTAISNTTNDAVYQAERFGNSSYHIPVPQSGTYSVDLHFAEIYWTSANKRIFNVSVENGQFAKQNLDLVQEFGGALTAGIITAEPITVTDGFLDIVFTTVKDNAKISGISVYSYLVENAAPVLQAISDVTLIEGQFWSHQLMASDPNPGDQLTYSCTGLPASLLLNASTGLIEGTIEVLSNNFPVTVKVEDQDGEFDEKSFTIVVRENNPPTIDTPPDVAVDQGQPFNYAVTASDGDPGDVLTYSAQGLPADLDINGPSGLISGTVTDVEGQYAVSVRATDQWGAFAETSFLFDVNYVNQPPTASVSVAASYCRDAPVSIPINANDPENGQMVFTVDPSGDPLPDGLMLDSSTGLISGTLLQTGNEGPSTHYVVVVKVTDPEDAFTTVTVNILSVDCTSGLRITSLTLVNSITDTDLFTLSDGMSINIIDLPGAINIRADVSEPAGTVKFGWQGNPNYRTEGVAPYSLGGDNGGNYNDLMIGLGTYTVTATPFSPGGGSVGTGMTLTFYVVEEYVNQPPTVNLPPDVVLKENESWTYQITASDPGDVITFSAVNLPPSLDINPNTGLITGVITVSPDIYDVTVTAEDSEGLAASTNFLITISENRPPDISVSVLPEFCRGTFLTILISASDPDGDLLTFQVDETQGDPLPDGLSINATTGTITGTLMTTGNEGPSTLYNVMVKVSDPDGASASTSVPIVSKDCGSLLQVTSLVLINSITDTEIITLTDGLSLNSSGLPSSMNIKANIGAQPVGSVRFGWQGNPNYRIENVAPYALAGDNNGNYNNLAMGEGNYTVTATPYQFTNASGAPGTSISLSFSIVKSGGITVARRDNALAEETSPTDESVTLYPNPAANEFFVKLFTEDKGAFSFGLINTLGMQSTLGTYHLERGEHVLHFDLDPERFPSGMYYVAIDHGKWKKTIKMLIR